MKLTTPPKLAISSNRSQLQNILLALWPLLALVVGLTLALLVAYLIGGGKQEENSSLSIGMALLGLLGLSLPLYLTPVGVLGLLKGRLIGHWALALPALLLGLAVCVLAATNRSIFDHLVFPLGIYLVVATAMQYLFLLGPQFIEWMLFRFKLLQPEAILTAQSSTLTNPEEVVTGKTFGRLQSAPTKNLDPSELNNTQSPVLSPQSLLALGAVVFYLITRLSNLLALPIFLDEAMHIAAGHSAQAGDLWAMANSGKALHGWLLAFIYNLSGAPDFLLVARLLSVLSGLVTLGGSYLIGVRLYSRRAGLIAMWLWAISPFALWHERMALVDTPMTAFTVLVFLVSLRLLDASSPLIITAYSLLLGLALGCAEMVKLPGAAAAIYPCFMLLFLYSPRRWLILATRLSIAAPVFFLTTIPLIRLYAGAWGSEYQDQRFAGFDAVAFSNNLRATVDWLYSYLTAPLLLLVLILPFWTVWQDKKRGAFLLLIAIIPLIVLVVISRISYSRYLLFMLVPCFILLAGMVDSWCLALFARRTKWLTFSLAGLGLVLLLPALWLDEQMIIDPSRATIPAGDHYQYIEGWASGYGVDGVANFLRQETRAHNQTSVVLVRDATVMARDGLLELLSNQPNIKIVPVSPTQTDLLARVREATDQGLIFLVITRADDSSVPLDGSARLDDLELLDGIRAASPDLHLTLVYTGNKPGLHSRMEVYRLDY